MTLHCTVTLQEEYQLFGFTSISVPGPLSQVGSGRGWCLPRLCTLTKDTRMQGCLHCGYVYKFWV